MKSIHLFIICILSILFFYSCQKEISLENGASASGTLKSPSSGDCLPSTIGGTYTANKVLDSTNYIDIEVMVSAKGNYTIISNTVNGFSFKATGNFTDTGSQTVHLAGSGTPHTTGTNNFIIFFDTTSCVLNVTTVAAGTTVPNAPFTFDAATGGTCNGAVLSGVYKQGTALNTSNTVVLSVNATAAGAYSIKTTATNGITFSGSGTFTSAGLQKVTLTASGTPVAAGNINITAGTGTSSCTFTVPVTASTTGNTPAVYTPGGAGSNCTGVVLGGTYQAGTALTTSNTAQIDVNVTTPGTYSITTNTKNNVTFSAAGSFAQAGTQKVTLVATGNPAAAGSQTYSVTAGSSTCNFPVTFIAPPAAATFTLSGTPGACAAAVVNGTYMALTPLNSTNTVTIKANVTVAGSYTITTATVNGMTFTATGTFASTGSGIDVTLTGTGAPATAGTSTFTPQAGGSGSSCSFNVSVSAAPAGIFSCKIDGVFTSFNFGTAVETTEPFTSTPDLIITGYVQLPSGFAGDEFLLSVTNNDGTAVGPGSYNVDGAIPTSPTQLGYLIEANYTAENPDLTTTIWSNSSSLFTQSPPFTIIITSISSTRVKGTFSGTLTDTGAGGSKSRIITEGVFDLPIP